MAERTFINFRCGFEIFVYYAEVESTFPAINERGTFSLLRLAEEDVFTMTQGAFVNFRVRGTLFVFHLACIGIPVLGPTGEALTRAVSPRGAAHDLQRSWFDEPSDERQTLG
jgi:hypothetical protein